MTYLNPSFNQWYYPDRQKNRLVEVEEHFDKEGRVTKRITKTTYYDSPYYPNTYGGTFSVSEYGTTTTNNTNGDFDQPDPTE